MSLQDLKLVPATIFHITLPDIIKLEHHQPMEKGSYFHPEFLSSMLSTTTMAQSATTEVSFPEGKTLIQDSHVDGGKNAATKPKPSWLKL